MSYDCIIIGGGLSGLTCGMKCASEGLRTLMISNGMNALHFSSGSIDLFGYNARGKAIEKPYDFLKNFLKENREHPYAKVGLKTIRESLDFFKGEVEKEKLFLYSNDEENHFHVTAFGSMKPAYLSPISVYNEMIKNAFEKKSKIAVLEFEGYRDFYSSIGIEEFRNNSMFKDTEIITGTIRMPHYTRTQRNLHEFRSIDLARVFDTERYLPRLAREIQKEARGAEIVGLPAFIGINNYNLIYQKIQELTGLIIYEVPTLPPSILGLRLDNALRGRFAALGGEYNAGDKVTGGNIEKGNLQHIYTENYGETAHRAKYFVLSTGSFFSGGLKSTFNHMEEPVFNLKFDRPEPRNQWYAKDFFASKSHRFLEYGVKTGRNLTPFDAQGKSVKNLYCTGAILSGYNPVREGSGGGVAIATGYHAALKIIKDHKG